MKQLNNLKIKKIAIFRALHLGDLLTAVPAFQALRKAWPNAKITLIGLPEAEKFANRYKQYIDSLIAFPGFLGLPEQPFDPEAFSSFLSKIQDEKIDLAIQMHGSGSITNGMMEMFEAKRLAGFYCKDGYRPNEQYFIQYPDDIPETERCLKLAKHLGADVKQANTEFPVTEAEKLSAKQLLKEYGLLEQKFVCIHAGAREQARRWSVANFAETADFISSKGYKVVLTGTDEERDRADKVGKLMETTAVNLCGKTGLGEAAFLLKKSRLLISNDTGMVHLASAAGAESIIIYAKKNSNIKRWAPPDRKRHSVITPERAQNVDNVLQKTDEKLREKTLQGANENYEHLQAV